VNRSKAIERAALLQDVLVVLLAVALARVARDHLAVALPDFIMPAAPDREYALLVLAFLPSWTLCAQRLQLHRMRVLTGSPVVLLRTLLWTQAWGGLSLALILVLAQVTMNRSFIALFLALSTAALVVMKMGQRRWALRHKRQSLSLLVLPDGTSERPADEPTQPGSPPRGAELARLRDTSVEVLPSADPAHLRRQLQQGGVDEVFLPPGLPIETRRELVATCELVGIPVFVPIEEVDLALVPPRAQVVGRLLYLTYHPYARDRPALLVKAVIDRLGAALLLLLFLPLLVAAALLVKMTSPGPAFFVQQRGGVRGRPFRMLKFRTMYHGAESQRAALAAANEADGPVFKMKNDPRLVPMGRFLRRTSIDELPQLVNVLLGDMSLVGPRPLPVPETQELTGAHRRRLSMKPGITGLWQVSGRSDIRFADWMRLDLQYIDSWSLSLDLAILLRTIPAVFSARGAR
jgi:exopolysaccharide biosynthesis polyprenyl glycosylphosphotransferase